MQNRILLFLSILVCTFSFGQESKSNMESDTIKLGEGIIISERRLSNYHQQKTLSSIDDYLEKSNRATMIKRGNYAWEPTLNNMTSERLAVTIDGMQIFGACTDKMDPITSYVDVSNLKNIHITSGQEGTENGHAIGGAIDLQLPNSKFNDSGLKSSIDMGYESNGNYYTSGLDLAFSSNKLYLSVDGIYRKSGNYKAGNNKEILYSQFEKYNFSFQGGYKLADHHSIDANIIYDRATDVGYPALPMDVSLAEAFIGSLSYFYKNSSSFIKSWETKFYYNTITHTMDDSQRPDVPIRMDMPGWSDTYGFYSKLTFKQNKHNVLLNLNGFYNQSLAEMTMYPNDINQPSMFMYTWPDVRTLYSGLYAKDTYKINTNESLSIATRLGFHKNSIANDEGFESLKIFYPNLTDSNNRLLIGATSNYLLKKNSLDFSVGLGYGERAPSVSEGYGFYLFNSFDRFDYIGNPNLSNEKSIETNLEFNYKFKHLKLGVEASYFHIMDYIIGEINPTLNTMTIDADGVKIYTALDHASIFNIYFSSQLHFAKHFLLSGSIGYNYGNGSNSKQLPLIKPISYFAELSYTLPKFNVAIQLEGNGNQSRYSQFYGEDETPAYGVLNLNLGNLITINNDKLVFKYGIENILDTNYSTYASWNNIPLQGRNFFLNISYIFN